MLYLHILFHYLFMWAPLVAQLVKNLFASRRPKFHPWVEKIPWRRERLPTPVFWPGEFHGLYSCKEYGVWGVEKGLATHSSILWHLWYIR